MTPGDALSSYGREGHLTPEQQQALDSLLEQLKGLPEFDPMPTNADTSFVLRYLRARNFDVGKARSMMVKAQQWRKEFGAEEIYRDFKLTPEQERTKTEMYPQFFHKTDKLGRPLYIMQPGVKDVPALLKVVNEELLTKNFVATVERVIRDKYPACAKAKGDPLVDATFIIMDMSGAGMSQFWSLKGPLKNVVDFSQNYYPETTGRIMIINVPYVFSTIWSIAKGWLAEETIAKVSIHGADYMPTLLSLVDEENIPREIGGKCKDCEECKSSDIGPWKTDEKEGAAATA